MKSQNQLANELANELNPIVSLSDLARTINITPARARAIMRRDAAEGNVQPPTTGGLGWHYKRVYMTAVLTILLSYTRKARG